ncbi:MAG: helix-turn-helix domain-containing protein, partial [Solirubrobacteraceae bacterium]
AGARLRRATAWRALQITRLAVLDDRAVEQLAQYPEIMRELLERSLERSRRLAVNMAIVHHPRVDIRLQMLFWHLADRWGRVRNGRTVLPLRLTHSVLADLIAAQRPTVSTALSDLASREIVRPAPDPSRSCAGPTAHTSRSAAAAGSCFSVDDVSTGMPAASLPHRPQRE